MKATDAYIEMCTNESAAKEFVILTEVEELRDDAARKGVDERKLRETVRAEYDLVSRDLHEGGNLHVLLRERSQRAIQKAD